MNDKIKELKGNNANRVLVTWLNYFGTSLDSAGHFFWQLSGNNIIQDRRLGFHSLPFNPENLTGDMENGDIAIHRAFGYSICAICGSPKDKRQGCKSVFWTHGIVDDWKSTIESIPIAKTIINQMPFELHWT